MNDPYNNVGERAAPKNVRFLPKKRGPDPTEDFPLWQRVRKIARMGGWNSKVKVDAVQVLAGTLEKAKAGRIKSIFVSIIWDDDSIACDYSQAKSSELLAHGFNVQTEVHKIVYGQGAK